MQGVLAFPLNDIRENSAIPESVYRKKETQ
jgi:hypothetical protein